MSVAMMSVADFAAVNFSRATGAGLDAHEYQRVTGELADLNQWGEALMRVARGHVARAERAATAISAGEHYQVAARWFHFATLGPGHEQATAAAKAHVGAAAEAGARAAAEADAAMGRALKLLEPHARRIEGPGFAGWLRGPADAAATVVVVPGLDSSKEEFHDLITALLLRGLAVFAMDGPGQGVLAAASTVRSDYHQVSAQVIDALGAFGVERVGLVGLSLGGYYVAESAAREPRVAAAVTVSGPFRLDWDVLPPPVRQILIQRAGGQDAGRRFVRQVDLSALAAQITCPLLVVDGGLDVIPGVTNGKMLARLAPRGEYVFVAHGDHLLGNARPDWLAATADWISERLT